MPRPDLVDAICAARDASDNGRLDIRPPITIRRNDGKLSIFASDDLARAMLLYQRQIRDHDYGIARLTLLMIEQSIQVEKLATLVCETIYPRLQIAVAAAPGTPVDELVLALYAQYARLTPSDIRARLERADEILAAKWQEIAGKEDELNAASLKAFYDSLPFPIACTLNKITQDRLALAYHALPLWVALSQKPTAAFDFGGNSGLMTSLMAAIGVEHCLLMDCSQSVLDFASWKDRRMGLHSIDYRELGAAAATFPQSDFQRFDFGICTEVLEHLIDVESAVAMMAALLKKGGLLFFSASFGHYPCSAHLLRNVPYAGREDDLFRRHGLRPIEADFPIPLAPAQRLYQKISGLG
ncbi:MAG: methyltransferase domain-containing protein [Rhodospirillales bacterium]|nr:methyltransferase domain-containing protein [Rhodospirillales bacterium]